MANLLIFAVPLVVAVALCLVAGRRRWAPSMLAALAVGAVLRLIVMLLAWRFNVRPYDFGVDFPVAADNVLHLRDPVLNTREGGWHFLPMMAYVLAGQRWVSQITGLDWGIAGRLVPIAADLVLSVVIGRLSAERGALRRFQWACNPLAIMVCSVHGQLEPIALAFGVAALVVARSDRPRRAVLAGLLLGLSIAANTWPVLLAPGLLLALPGLRRKVTAALSTAAVLGGLVLTEPLLFSYGGLSYVSHLRALIATMAHTRPVVGGWGWTAIAEGGHQTVDPSIGTVGTLILAAGVLAAMWWWRRADPLTFTVAVLLAFLICTHRLGAQYLLWPLPYLLARPMRGTWAAVAAASAWSGIGYLWLGTTATWNVWWMRHEVWALSSLVVVPILIYALPWAHRRRPPEPEPVPVPAGERRPDRDLVRGG